MDDSLLLGLSRHYLRCIPRLLRSLGTAGATICAPIGAVPHPCSVIAHDGVLREYASGGNDVRIPCSQRIISVGSARRHSRASRFLKVCRDDDPRLSKCARGSLVSVPASAGRQPLFHFSLQRHPLLLRSCDFRGVAVL